jgi:hypothetical protein
MKKNTTTISETNANEILKKLGNEIVNLDNQIDKKIGQADCKMYNFSIEYAVRINSQYPNGASKKEITAFNKLVFPENMKTDTRKKLSAMGNNDELLELEKNTRKTVGESYKSSDLKDAIDKTKVDKEGKKTADTFRKMQKAFQNKDNLAESRSADISAGGEDATNMRNGLHWLSNDDIQNIFLTLRKKLKVCTDNDKAFVSMEAREKAFEAIDRMIINIIKQNNKNAS